MTMLWLLLSLLASLAFYLASPHQRLWLRASSRRGLWRALGWAGCALALVAAVADLGTWAGVFSALTAWMFGASLLPYLDAWRRANRETPHVG